MSQKTKEEEEDEEEEPARQCDLCGKSSEACADALPSFPPLCWEVKTVISKSERFQVEEEKNQRRSF